MHLSLFLLVIAIACLSRVLGHPVSDRTGATWSTRWRNSLSAFLLPPLLMLMTAISVLCMGTQGRMLGLPVGWIGYLLAFSFFGGAAGVLLRLSWMAGRSLRQLQAYPTEPLAGAIGHILDTPKLFAAQVGWWRSQLVVSRGLLTHLTPAQLTAVLTHEQAHAYYRDTFWFFWLGWLRQLTAWLPHTPALWQELLLLRELRADHWAAQRVDPLLLAESLLLTVQDSAIAPDYCAAFSAVAPPSRLEERVEALLMASASVELESADQVEAYRVNWFSLTGLLLAAFVPLLTLLIHR
jgi:Zn-dependent protease with chaperone function